MVRSNGLTYILDDLVCVIFSILEIRENEVVYNIHSNLEKVEMQSVPYNLVTYYLDLTCRTRRMSLMEQKLAFRVPSRLFLWFVLVNLFSVYNYIDLFVVY